MVPVSRSPSPVSDDIVAMFERASLDEGSLCSARKASALTRNSFSPRGSLISVIESGDVSDIAVELSANASRLSALELAVSLYVLTQHPQQHEVVSAVADGVLMLANRFSTNITCDNTMWAELQLLFLHKPSCKELAQFLRDDESLNNDQMTDEFASDTCAKLAETFALSSQLIEVILKNSVPWWIDMQVLQAKACIPSLCLAYTMCAPDQEDVDVEFVIKAIGTSMLEERIQACLNQCNNFIGDKPWDFLQALSLPVIVQILEKLPKYDITFLMALFSHLTSQLSSLQPDTTALIIKLVSEKPWNFDNLNVEDVSLPAITSYKPELDKFIQCDIKTLSTVLDVEDEKKIHFTEERAWHKCIQAIVSKLENVAATAESSLKDVSNKKRNFRLFNRMRFKTHCITFAFFLYESIKEQPTKKQVFSYLADKLLTLRVTIGQSENKVVQIIQNAMSQLVYMANNTKYAITYDAASTLSTQTPRFKDPPAE